MKWIAIIVLPITGYLFVLYILLPGCTGMTKNSGQQLLFKKYYNLNGKLVREKYSDKNDKILVLTYEESDTAVRKAIIDTQTIAVLPDKIVDMIWELFIETEKNKKEHYFAVGEGNVTSRIVRGLGNLLDSLTVSNAIKDLADAKYLYNVHSHPSKLESDSSTQYGIPEPSPQDLKEKTDLPRIVTGFRHFYDDNNVAYLVPHIGFYTDRGLINKCVDIGLEKFIDVIKKINREKDDIPPVRSPTSLH